MNCKQSLKACRKYIDELEEKIQNMSYQIMRNAADIKAYNEVIDGMIAGKSPCDWCEDLNECQRAVKGQGCAEWWLRYKEGENESEGILPERMESGTADQAPTGSDPAL